MYSNPKATIDTWVITCRNTWRERISFAFMLLFCWPKSSSPRRGTSAVIEHLKWLSTAEAAQLSNYDRINQFSITSRVAIQRIKALENALAMMVEEKCDYMRINHLGNPEKQHTVKVARKAMAENDNDIQGR